MVKTAGVHVVISATAIGAKQFSSLVGILHLYTAQTLIVATNTVPVRTALTHSARIGTRHLPAGSTRTNAVGIFIDNPRQVRRLYSCEVLCAHVFTTRSNAVVHIGVEVITLIETDLTDIEGAAQCHDGVPLVTTALLHLTEVTEGATLVGQYDRDKIANKFITAIVDNHGELGTVLLESALMVIFVETYTLVVHMDIIA